MSQILICIRLFRSFSSRLARPRPPSACTYSLSLILRNLSQEPPSLNKFSSSYSRAISIPALGGKPRTYRVISGSAKPASLMRGSSGDNITVVLEGDEEEEGPGSAASGQQQSAMLGTSLFSGEWQRPPGARAPCRLPLHTPHAPLSEAP